MTLKEKGFDYSIRIAELVRFLREEGGSFPFVVQRLGWGVEVGLTCGVAGKLNLPHATSCLREADYLIEMAAKAGYLTEQQTVYIREDGRTLLQMLEQAEKAQENEP